MCREVHIKRAPTEDDFEIVEVSVPEPGAGRRGWLSRLPNSQNLKNAASSVARGRTKKCRGSLMNLEWIPLSITRRLTTWALSWENIAPTK